MRDPLIVSRIGEQGVRKTAQKSITRAAE